jgi:hypothetical protein
MKFILPSEAQSLIFDMDLREEYFKKDFTKYEISDYGLYKLRNQLKFDQEFQEKLFKRKINKRYLNHYRFKMYVKDFVFYDEKEVTEWVAKKMVERNKNS